MARQRSSSVPDPSAAKGAPQGLSGSKGRLERLVFLNIQKTGDLLGRDVAVILKPAALSATQYNVLRILRTAGPDGLACGDIADKMLTRDPDLTRLLDRLEKRGLVTRRRGDKDRRVVRSAITPAAIEILAGLDEPIMAMHVRQLQHLGDQRLRQLRNLLAEAREILE